MASSVSRQLHNFRLPPWSSLTAAATNSAAIPPLKAAAGAVESTRQHRLDQNKPPESSKDNPITRSKIMLKFKLGDKAFKVTSISSGSDHHEPTSEASSSSLPGLETPPESMIADRPEPPQTVVRKKAIKRTRKENNNKRFCFELSRKEIEEDMFAIKKSLGKRMKRPESRSKQLQKQLDLLCPGFELK